MGNCIAIGISLVNSNGVDNTMDACNVDYLLRVQLSLFILGEAEDLKLELNCIS